MINESIKILEQLFVDIKKLSSDDIHDKAELSGIVLCIHKLKTKLEVNNE